MAHTILKTGAQSAPVKLWDHGVEIDDGTLRQVKNLATMPFIHRHVAVMPDAHAGIGCSVGTVVPTVRAIIPAAVGVDLGCGMSAVRTTLTASDLPESLSSLRSRIERAVPHGKSSFGQAPSAAGKVWAQIERDYHTIVDKHREVERVGATASRQLGTLGGGNHFIEVCLDEDQRVWVMLHSGSRGIGNAIGTHFISLARKDMERHQVRLPDRDLAYFEEGSTHFADYMFAVGWAQRYALENRRLMMAAVLDALHDEPSLPPFQLTDEAVHCHHNYVAIEEHFGTTVYVTRKGAVRAGRGELGIIPGSMGAKSFIVRGKGNADSFESCSHGAGRRMSRTEARKRFSVRDHEEATAGVECRKDSGVLDETPRAYKDIDAVMRAQADLVEIMHTLRQVVCVKG